MCKVEKILSRLEETDMVIAMAPEDYNKDAEKATELFNKEMKKIFPKADFAVAKVRLFGGEPAAIGFGFAYDRPAIIQNSNTYTQFIMHLTDKSGKQRDMTSFEIEMLQMSYKLGKRGAGVTYRKIKGKTPMEATKKLIEWFKKNKDVLIEVGEANK